MPRCFLIILFISSSVLFAQQLKENVFTLYPAAGINGCQIHGDGYSGYNKLGIFAGIAVNARLKSRSSLDIGFYFSQKGARHIPAPAKGDYSYYRLNLNYVDIPVSFKFYLNPRYFITMGPSLAYLVSYNENINYANFTGAYKFNRFEAGVNIGLGRSLYKNKFFVEVRCSNSITPIREYGTIANLVFYPNPVARFFNKGFYNNILTLIVSYKLPIKPKTNESK